MITNPNVKINLGLNILRKREDGFHDLETLFVPYFGITDTLEIVVGDDYSRTSAALFAKYGSQEPATQGSVKPEGVFGVETEELTAPKIVQGISEDGKLMITIARSEGVDWEPLKDLTAKAYFILAEEFQMPPVKIFLEKTSPVGAGLGGGSADAAFMLKLLNDKFQLKLSVEKLEEYASRLGADCAFFIQNKPVFASGIGNIFEPVQVSLKGYYIVLVKPDVFVSTKEAYSLVQPKKPAQSLKEIARMPVETWRATMKNDFEESVFKLYPEIAAIKDKLYDMGAVYASMSGSGSSVFGIFREQVEFVDEVFSGCFCRQRALE